MSCACVQIKGLQDDLQKEREMREAEVLKEREMREAAVKHERELRAEAVKAAEAQVDRRVLDLLYAEEYQGVRARLERGKQVRPMLNHHGSSYHTEMRFLGWKMSGRWAGIGKMVRELGCSVCGVAQV
jgi:hypothetical protein